MATLVKLRGCVFIPAPWLAFEDPATGRRFEFQGDDREFTPHAVNTLRFRVEQEIVVDFVNQAVHSYAATGITRERITGPDGFAYRTGRADTSGITVNHVSWGPGVVELEMQVCAKNPLLQDADSVDYLLRATVHEDGTVHLRGAHDGFPCYEFYKQVELGELQPIYTHDYRLTGDTVRALADPMKYSFDRTA